MASGDYEALTASYQECADDGVVEVNVSDVAQDDLSPKDRLWP